MIDAPDAGHASGLPQSGHRRSSCGVNLSLTHDLKTKVAVQWPMFA